MDSAGGALQLSSAAGGAAESANMSVQTGPDGKVVLVSRTGSSLPPTASPTPLTTIALNATPQGACLKDALAIRAADIHIVDVAVGPECSAAAAPEPAAPSSEGGGFDHDEDVRIFIGQLDGDGEVTIDIRNPSVDVAAVQLSLIDQDGAPLEGVSLLESPLLPDVTLGGAGLLAYSPDGGTIAAGDQQRLLVRLAVDSPVVQSVCPEQVQATTPSLFLVSVSVTCGGDVSGNGSTAVLAKIRAEPVVNGQLAIMYQSLVPMIGFQFELRTLLGQPVTFATEVVRGTGAATDAMVVSVGAGGVVVGVGVTGETVPATTGDEAQLLATIGLNQTTDGTQLCVVGPIFSGADGGSIAVEEPSCEIPPGSIVGGGNATGNAKGGDVSLSASLVGTAVTISYMSDVELAGAEFMLMDSAGGALQLSSAAGGAAESANMSVQTGPNGKVVLVSRTGSSLPPTASPTPLTTIALNATPQGACLKDALAIRAADIHIVDVAVGPECSAAAAPEPAAPSSEGGGFDHD